MNPGGDVAVVLKYHNKNILKSIFTNKKAQRYILLYVVASVFLNTSIFI